MISGKLTTEKEYRALEMDSSSSLKEFSMDRKKYYKKYIKGEKTEEDDSKASITGNLVELLLWEKDRFDEKFHISSVVNPPDTTTNMGKFVDSLAKYTDQATDENGNLTRSFEEIAKDAYKESGFKWSFETVLSKFEGSENEIYYKELKEIKAKKLTPITLQDNINAENIVHELKVNEFTSPILTISNSDRYTILIQNKLDNFKIDGLPLKAMMDYVIIDHKEKTIQIYDLKCTYSTEGFYENYYLYRRAYIQAYVYKEAGKELKERMDLEYYTVLNPKFIVSDSINYMNPLIYELDSDDIEDAYNGFEYKGVHYPGVKDIIADLLWAKENDKWNISRKNYLNNGIVNIKG